MTIRARLRDFQQAPADWLLTLLANGTNALDASDCGAGKTYTACAVASALRLPTLVVSPAISTTHWSRVAAHFGDTLSVVGWEMLRTGRTPYGHWANPRPEGNDKIGRAHV